MKGSKQPRLSHKFAILQHSHKKRKYSLETRAVLLVYWLQLESSGAAVQEIHRNSEKAVLTVRIFFFFSFSVVIATVQRLLRQLYRLLQMKKIITNAPCVL